MASASFAEIIAHFAGYLQIFQDIARDRIQYDDHLAPRPSDDYTTPRPDDDFRFVPDDMDTAASPAPAPLSDDPIHLVRGRPLKLLHDAPDSDPDFFKPLSTPKITLPMPGGGGGSGHSEHHIKVTYQEDGQQTQLTVHQFNVMHDDDANLPPGAMAVVDPLIVHVNASAMATIEQLASNANEEIPSNWQMPQNDAGAKDFLSAHDAAWADRGGTPDEHSVPVGYYVNGEVQEHPTEPTPPAEPPTLPDTGDGIGQWATLGSNFSVNAALIVDIGEGVRTMVVMGDYFKTDAIFQTNTIVDHDQISVLGGNGAPSVSCGHDAATNIADFVQNPSIYTGFAAQVAGPNWKIDVVDGDYYSVHAVAQVNYLSDNDVGTQVSGSTHYNLVGGHNEQGNLSLVLDGSIQYDLIIIKGSYHGMNVIFQNNILLNNDKIVMAADGSDPSQSVDSGSNSLLNQAAIENFGGDNIDTMPPNFALIESLLASGVTSIDPALGSALVGNGGSTLKVLYITGDYYDINAVWQTNVTSDVNVMYQLQNRPSSDLLARDPDGDVTQSVSTGDNRLTNDTAIVDVNPDHTYVAGHVYADSILVQANLLPSAPDTALNTNTDRLATELIAFVDDAQDTTAPPPAVVANTVHADPMASMLH
ncbi:hypothetical protein CQ14_00615 [Bradyrhizobium lablabi]|uniref:Type I secretion protein n=1 Tax=Bradyrhizobium lablabi TaxID=722472 RepID=A0A0R3MRP6_9BRAD|nr:hypothetical protein [Bradyrhizobium lablabi]KRR22834.1 hypothetical protein CQ14_00615 [Bradyrhizobium lablabi]